MWGLPHGVEACEARQHEHGAGTRPFREHGALHHQIRRGVDTRGVDALPDQQRQPNNSLGFRV